MNSADRLKTWNEWYDNAPSEWRFQLVLWPLLLVGAINLALTIAGGFPFGLLLLVAIAVVAAIRLPHLLQWIEATPGDGSHRIQIRNAEWLHHLNVAYESLPDSQRFWILPAVLIAAGAINMALSIHVGFPFGLLFLIALLVMVGIRAPFVHGFVPAPASLTMQSPPSIGSTEQAAPMISRDLPVADVARRQESYHAVPEHAGPEPVQHTTFNKTALEQATIEPAPIEQKPAGSEFHPDSE